MMAKFAFTAIVVPEGYRLALAMEGKAGYVPAERAPMLPPGFREDQYEVHPTLEAAREAADRVNEWLGVGKDEAFRIVASSIAEQPKPREEIMARTEERCSQCGVGWYRHLPFCEIKKAVEEVHP